MESSMLTLVQVGSQYVHHTGYTVTVIALSESESGEPMVTYTRTDNGRTVSVPLASFSAPVTVPRFTLAPPAVAALTAQTPAQAPARVTATSPQVTAPASPLAAPTTAGNGVVRPVVPLAPHARLAAPTAPVNRMPATPAQAPTSVPTATMPTTPTPTPAPKLPYPDHPALSMTAEERFYYWVSERHNIYKLKQHGEPKPWTDDPILQSYYFTNPYREHDKVTVWFKEYIREPLRENLEVIFATILFRTFIHIKTAEYFIEAGLFTEWNPTKALSILQGMVGRGEQYHTGAYTVATSGARGPKHLHLVNTILTPIWNRRKELTDYFSGENEQGPPTTLQEAHMFLGQYPNMGGSGFNAYEVVCDLRYTRWLEHATDVCTWSNPGPGAKRGLNRILNRPLTHKVTHEEYQRESLRLLHSLQRRFPRMPKFEMREVEMTLCETDKYDRVLLGQGHSKRRYPGAG